MNKLLTDAEVAAQIGFTKGTVASKRSQDRGQNLDRIPKWVDTPGLKRPRVRGTTQAQVDAWLARNQVGAA